MTALVISGDARSLPLPDESVDLIVTSPPYWSLRSYVDDGEHYGGQIGSEPTPAEYIDTLIDCTREWVRVLKRSGSLWVNLGDAFSRGLRYDSEFTAHDAAWLAGVIDSDGSVSIRVDNGGRSHVAWTRVGQMRREVVERIGSVTGVGKMWQDGRGVWNWSAAAQQARWVLERIWPWLHIKQRQALAAVDLMTQKAEGGRKGKWNQLTDEDLRRRELIRQAVLAWNRGEEFPHYDPPVVALPHLPADPQWIQAKSLLGLPWRYALACIDQLGLILRAEVIWQKPNGLPESVTDRVRRSHEQWFHFTREPRYYSAVDEIREPHTGNAHPRGANARVQTWASGNGVRHRTGHGNPEDFHPLGKLPGSVWTVPSEPLKVPIEMGIDHFAAFPTEWPRRIIAGWSPPGICVECGDGRRPTAAAEYVRRQDDRPGARVERNRDNNRHDAALPYGSSALRLTTITGYACACPEPTAPTRPAVVLDPFGGTGTTALVAAALGRIGLTIDRSADYCRLATWRTSDPAQRAKVLGVAKPPVQVEGQMSLLDGEAS